MVGFRVLSMYVPEVGAEPISGWIWATILPGLLKISTELVLGAFQARVTTPIAVDVAARVG